MTLTNGREIKLYGQLSRNTEGKGWVVLGEWDEDADYLVVDVLNTRIPRHRALIEKKGYERVRCYPIVIPLYMPRTNPEVINV